MRKIGLIIDSATGLTMAEANEKGHAMIPLQVSINGDLRKAGVNVTTNDVITAMDADKKNVEIKTSLPNGTDIEAAFDWILERYEKAIYIGISHRMSGTNNAVKTVLSLNDKYQEKITVYESEYSSPWTAAYLDEFERILEENDDIDKIIKILDLAKPYIYGHLSPEDIYWFYKGGRITKAQYIAGSLLKVKPVLTVVDGNLDQDSIVKARGTEKAMDKMIEMVEVQTEKLKSEGLNYKILIIDSSKKELTEQMAEKVSVKFGVDKKDIIVIPVSTEQTAHMGPGACGIAALVPLSELERVKGVK